MAILSTAYGAFTDVRVSGAMKKKSFDQKKKSCLPMHFFLATHRNSGVIGGKFLERTRVSKPGSSVDNPEFYHPNDFSIGAPVVVFNHNFVITDADTYVVKYMEQHSADFATETINSLRQKHGTVLQETGAR